MTVSLKKLDVRLFCFFSRNCGCCFFSESLLAWTSFNFPGVKFHIWKKTLFSRRISRCEVDFGIDVGLRCLGWRFILRLGSGWFSRSVSLTTNSRQAHPRVSWWSHARYNQASKTPKWRTLTWKSENQRITSKLYSGVTPQFRNMIFFEVPLFL